MVVPFQRRLQAQACRPGEWLFHSNALQRRHAPPEPCNLPPSSLSDLKNRSENLTGRSQISSILKGNSSSIARESGGIWIVQADLQPISFKSDRLLG